MSDAAYAASESAAGERILVIKLGALGDVVLATGAMAAIRAHHPAAHIALLTTEAMLEAVEQCPLFDEIWIDLKPGAFNLPGWWSLGRRLRSGRFTRIYDLQNSSRSARYFRLTGLPGLRPEWSGTRSEERRVGKECRL